MEKQVSSETIFEGHIFTVKKDMVECDNGMIAPREMVFHHGGVSVLAVEDDCILLVKQYRYTLGQDMIEVPAGKLEKDEDPTLAAYREFEEETKRRAEKMALICPIVATPGYCSEVIRLYEATDFKEVDDARSGDEDENLNLIKMPINEAYDKIFDGTITDSKTIIAIQYAYTKYCLKK